MAKDNGNWLLYGIVSALVLALMWAWQSGIYGAAATEDEALVCTVVANDEEAYRHSYAEAKFHSLPEWEHRHKAFQEDFSDGVTVKMSSLSHFPGLVVTNEVTISTEAEYKEARRRQYSDDFLSRALRTVVLPGGEEVHALHEQTGSVTPASRGARVRYYFYNDPNPVAENFWCFEVEGKGHPTPTPTPEPAPVEADPEDHADSEE